MDKDKQLSEGPYDFRTLFGEDAAGKARAATAAEDGTTDPGHELTNGHTATDAEIVERCRKLAAEAMAGVPVYANNILQPCKGELVIPPCQDVKLPDLRPRVYVFWGAARCDCIEGDDTEIMTILVYNPYHNLTLSNVEINRLIVVDASGNPVPVLPDGSDSIQLVPRGTYCFGDIRPCGFAYRQFVLRLRGAPPGTYRILIQGLCFEICLHRLIDDCVMFEVCRD
ncbi:MAG TPA: hypothetical protein VFQ67_05735 [Allosphingosinicella sp.]|jgi:hypothetical protein|nr:hypothetical protein [Allosphingosinicella sp.]